MSEIVLYNLSFDAPTDTPGLPPSGKSGFFGQPPLVQAPFGPLTSQSLQFKPGGSGDLPQGIYFDIGAGASAYRLGFDFYFPYSHVTFGVLDEFQVELGGTTSAYKLNLYQDGLVRFDAPGFGGDIGVFPDSVITHFALGVDVAGQNWSVSMNGNTIFAGGFTLGTDLQRIRMFFVTQGSPNLTSVAVDNVRIEAIPEPSVLNLSLVACALIVLTWSPLRRRCPGLRRCSSH